MAKFPSMRRYLQGTLDFHCGIYCIINALSCLKGIDLHQGRAMISETVLEISRDRMLLQAFLRNQTDHYWVVRYVLARWGIRAPFKVKVEQPFGLPWLEGLREGPNSLLDGVHLFLPEMPPAQDEDTAQATVWEGIRLALAPNKDGLVVRTVVFRFHRYLHGLEEPVVSHWTTGIRVLGDVLLLHDASGEANSLHSIDKEDLLPVDSPFRHIRIVPESVIVLST